MAVRRKTEIVAYSTKKILKNFIYFLLSFNFYYLLVRVFIHLENFSLVQTVEELQILIYSVPMAIKL